MNARWERLQMPLMASLTLGLAPFVPEPHVVEKLRMLFTAPATLAPIDVFDLLMHGAPWVWLAVTLVRPAVKQPGETAPT